MQVSIVTPDSLSDITLDQYQRFKALDPNSDADFLARKMLDIFCGVKDVLEVRKKDVDRVTNKILSALSQPAPLQTTFTLDGVEYGFIPNIEEMTFGEYIDLDNLLDWSNMHRAMNVLYRPIVSKAAGRYTIEKYVTSSKYDFKKLPLNIPMGALVFFWTLSKDLLIDTVDYLQKEMEAAKTLAQEANTLKSMDGLRQSLNLLGETLPSLTKWKDYQLANAFLSYSTLQKANK